MPAHRRLPPPAELRRLYVDQNMSLHQIAERYGCKGLHTVRQTLERDARKDGVAWPLKGRGRGHWTHRKVAAQRTTLDHVRSILVAAEIREAMTSFGLSQDAFAALSGVSQGQISKILQTSKTGYCKRTTAQKVEAAIRDLEKRRRLSESNLRSWAKRKGAA